MARSHAKHMTEMPECFFITTQLNCLTNFLFFFFYLTLLEQLCTKIDVDEIKGVHFLMHAEIRDVCLGRLLLS